MTNLNFQNKIKKISIILLFTIFIYNLLPCYGDDLDYTEDNLNIDEASIQETSASISEKPLNLNSRYCVVLDRTSKQKLFGKSEE